MKPLNARNEFKSMSDRIFIWLKRAQTETLEYEEERAKYEEMTEFYLKSYTYISSIVWCVLLFLRRNNQSLITFLIQELVDMMN